MSPHFFFKKPPRTPHRMSTGGRTLTAWPPITPPWTSLGVQIFTTQMDFLLVILPRFSRNILTQTHTHTLKHTRIGTHTFFFAFAEKVLWVRQRTIKQGEKTRVPVWQSTQLQTTGYELCNKNSIKTNVWKTKEEIDTGTLAVPNSQDMISDCVLIVKCHTVSFNNLS